MVLGLGSLDGGELNIAVLMSFTSLSSSIWVCVLEEDVLGGGEG